MTTTTTEVSQLVGNTVPASFPSPDLGCDVCFKILEFFNTPFREGRKVVLGRVADLMAYKCPHSDWIRNIQWCHGPVPRYAIRDLVLSKHGNQRGTYWLASYWTRITKMFNWTNTFTLVFRPEIPNHPGTARVLDKSWISLDVVKDWRYRCMEEHGNECERSAIPGLTPFRPQWLVDVNEACIVPCEGQGTRFLTLSYTWGQTGNFRTTRSTLEEVRQPGAFRSGRVASQIPDTISHAIELTKALGESRLWVESLCIVQDDQAALTHQLENMHLIYAASFLTIIARDGRDASYGLRGLRGISPPRATTQHVVDLAGGEKLAMVRQGWIHGRRTNPRDYDQRMWTFQERVFAQGRLIFSNGSISWQCNRAAWSESDLYHPGGPIFSSPIRDSMPDGLLSRVPSLDHFDRLIMDFNRMHLSIDEDVVNAFAGIHTHLNNIFPSGLVFGHPELFFERALCWYPYDHYNLRRREASRLCTSGAAYAPLPSWSWMGWQGITKFPEDTEHTRTGSLRWQHGFTESVTQWYAIESPTATSRRPVDSAWSRCRKAAPQTIPKGWTSAEFKPAEILELETDATPSRLHPHYMPRELPTHIYRHVSQKDQPQEFAWYPVPVVDDTYPTQTPDPGPHCWFRYLQCETSRAYLVGSSEKVFEQFRDDYFHSIHDSNGYVIGGLKVHNSDDGQLFETGSRKIEVIAIAKGWRDLPRRFQDGQTEIQSEVLNATELTEEEIQREKMEIRWERSPSPTFVKSYEHTRAERLDCYHVLWIEWQDNIAYRKASSFVVADKWEEYAEPAKVNVILG